jgi:hypothetical protein
MNSFLDPVMVNIPSFTFHTRAEMRGKFVVVEMMTPPPKLRHRLKLLKESMIKAMVGSSTLQEMGLFHIQA